MASQRPHGHAPRHQRSGAAAAGGAAARSACWWPLRVPRPARRPSKDPLARRAMPSGWSAAASCGRRRRTAAWRSRPPSSATCWTRSADAIRSGLGGRRWLANPAAIRRGTQSAAGVVDQHRDARPRSGRHHRVACRPGRRAAGAPRGRSARPAQRRWWLTSSC